MKQIFALFLGLLLVFSLAACSKTGEGPSDGASANPGQSTTPSENDTILDDTPVTKPPTKNIYFWTEKKVSVGNRSSVYTREYDAKGNLLKDSYRAHDNSAGYTYTYTYDESGKRLSEACVDQAGSSWNVTYTYDDGGKMTTKTTTDADGSETEEYFYDENGKLMKTISVHSIGLQTVKEYTYNTNGYLLKEETYSIRGAVSEKTETKVYEYDKKGNMTGCSVYDEEKLLDQQHWIYDGQGRLTAEIRNIVKGFGEGTFYTYDNWGKLRMEATGTFYNDRIQDIEFYDELRYNEWKLLGKRICFSGDDVITGEYEYIYDSHGNLTKEIHYQYKNNNTSVTEYKYIAIEVPND